MAADLIAQLAQDRKTMKQAAQALKERGIALARAEAEYQAAKNRRALQMKAEGTPATMIGLTIKGDPEVGMKMFERDCARVEYESAQEALNVYKLDARLLEAQIDREWRG